MQSSPIVLSEYQRPIGDIEDLLPRLAKKGGFDGYHYMILANGLIKNREFIGDKHYLHALHDLEVMTNVLSDTLSTEKLNSMLQGAQTVRSSNLQETLQQSTWKGEKVRAFAALRQYLREHGPTQELTAAIAHSFTKINQYPHDPHYVTFPLAAFELIPHLSDDDVELVLAHCVEFATDRIRQHGFQK